MKYLSSAFVAAILMLLSGCASILTAEQTAPQVQKKNLESVKIAVVDHRPYVVSGEKLSSFEGISRSAVGIPYTRNLRFGETMPNFLGQRIIVGFNRAGIKAQLIPTKPSTQLETISSNDSPVVIMVLNEWKYDHHAFADSSWYDFDLLIKDAAGNVLINKNFTGEQDIPSMHSNDLQKLYQQRLEMAFKDSEVQALL